MPSKFGGIPVEGGSKFGGVPVTGQPQVQSEKPVSRGYVQDRLAELKAMGQGARYSVAETALGIGQVLGAADEGDVQTFRDNREQARAEAAGGSPRGDAFFGGGQTVGEIGQALLPIGAAGAGFKAANYGRAALAGGAYGASRPVMGDESRLINTGIAAGANVAGVGLAQGVTALGKVAPQMKRDIFNAARDRKIPLTFAQMSDTPFVKRLAAMSDALPFSGARARNLEQTKAVNRNVAMTFGGKVNSDKVIDLSTTADRYEKFGPQFDAVMDGGMGLDRPLLEQVSKIWQRAEELDDVAKNNVEIWVRRLQDQSKDGRLTGDTLRSLDKQLREAGTGGSDKALVAREFRNAVHDAFGRQAPDGVKPAWDKLRRQYSNFLDVEKVVAGNPEGPLPPQQLYNAVTNNQRGKNAITRGRGGELANLGMIGRQMRGPSTSGTAENAQAAATSVGLLTNPVSTLGLLLTGNSAGRALNSHGLARLMMSEGRGQIAPLAPYARPLPLLLSGAANANRPKRP